MFSIKWLFYFCLQFGIIYYVFLVILQCFFTQDKILKCIIVNLSSRRFMNTSTENYKCFAALSCSLPPLTCIFFIIRRLVNTSTVNYIRILHYLASSFSLLHIYIISRFMNTSTENYIRILHSLASSFSPLHIYIFRRFVNTSTENFTRILHSLASSFSPLHIYFFWPQLHALTFPALCLNPTRNLPTSTLTYSHWLPKLLHSVVQYVLTVLLNK